MNSNFFDRLQPIYEVYARVVDKLMTRRHVVACGIGLKMKNGELTDLPGLVISVERKVPAADLSDDDMIPPRIDDVDTDVVETGQIRPLGLSRTSIVRPVRPGASIAHMNGSAGTAGCVVNRGEEVFMLTNNHVAALVNRGRIGDPVLQPSPQDGGTTLHTFGQLTEFIPLQFLPSETTPEAVAQSAEGSPSGCAALVANLFHTQARSPDGLEGSEGTPITDEEPSMVRVNRLDVALVKPIEGVTLDPRIIDIAAPPAGMGTVGLGETVIKSGRTTGLTEGRVMQIDVTVDVAYEEGKARFTNQIMATPFSQRGDSGSLVMDTRRNAVGLLFSGSDAVSVFHPIETVLNTLKVKIVTS